MDEMAPVAGFAILARQGEVVEGTAEALDATGAVVATAPVEPPPPPEHPCGAPPPMPIGQPGQIEPAGPGRAFPACAGLVKE